MDFDDSILTIILISRPFLIKSLTIKKRAGDETRTRDINLGKVALYQLSYTRVLADRHPSGWGSGGSSFFAGKAGSGGFCFVRGEGRRFEDCSRAGLLAEFLLFVPIRCR
jgi:hypothetical protein